MKKNKLTAVILLAAFLLVFAFPAVASDYTTDQIMNQIRGIKGSAIRTIGLTIVGSDGTNNQFLRLDSTGHPQVDVLTMPSITVTGVATQTTLAAISAQLPASLGIKTAAESLSVVLASDGVLPLPTGAATAALQTAGNTSLSTLAGAVAGTEMQVDVVSSALPSGASTAALQTAGNTSLSTLAGAVAGTEIQADIVSSALPTGASTSALQTNGNNTLTSIDGKLTSCNTSAIAGTVTANAGTNLNTSLLALETGGNLATIAGKDFATSALQTAGNASLATIAGFTCNTSAVTVSSALPAGTNTIGNIGAYGGGSGGAWVHTSGASGANLLAGTADKKHRIWKIYVVTGASETITLSDGCGEFKSDANGVFYLDFNPIGNVQGTANTAITITTGAASAWTASVLYKDE